MTEQIETDIVGGEGARRPKRPKWPWAAGLIAAGFVAGGVMAGTLSATAQTPTPSATTPSATTPNAANPNDADGGGHYGGGGGRHAGETALTGTTLEKVTAAALKAVPGATIERVETDAEGSPYEAHMRKADGTEVTAKVDKDFKVTSVEAGHGNRPASSTTTATGTSA
jgi:hypothetical protein